MRAPRRAALAAVALALLALSPTVAAAPWIARVHPRAEPGWATEFVVVANPDPAPVALDGWSLTDGEGVVPLKGTLAPGGRLLVVENATQYGAWNLSVPAPFVVFEGTRFKLANGGDEVQLVDPGGRTVDAVVYGEADGDATNGSASVEGWTGPPVPRPAPREVLLRRGTDTDRAEDFSGLRRLRFGQSEVRLPPVEDVAATLYTAPDSAHRVTTAFLARAHTRLEVNLYELTHLGVAEALFAAQDRGVNVTVLLEGGPVGWNFTRPEPDPHLEPGRWTAWRSANRQTWIAAELRERGATVHTMGNARYRFDHAKYAVRDGEAVLVTTENWGFTGLPEDPSYGNRGFGAVVHDRRVAAALSALFRSDADPRRPDVRPHRLAPDPAFRSGYTTPTGTYESRLRPHHAPDARVLPVVSPDTSADVLELLASARDRLLLWALDLNPDWGGTSPLRDALVAAADRGADVRVLVNDNPRYDPDQPGRLAAELGPLGIEVAGLRAGEPFVNLHAKAAVVDDAAYVGSMNFNHAAFTVNREVGVIVEDPGAAAWMADVFEHDWVLAGMAKDEPATVAGLDPMVYVVVAAIAAGGGLAWVSRRPGRRGDADR